MIGDIYVNFVLLIIYEKVEYEATFIRKNLEYWKWTETSENVEIWIFISWEGGIPNWFLSETPRNLNFRLEIGMEVNLEFL